MPKKNRTTLWVSKETAQALAQLGTKRDTYDQIIRRLINVAKGEVDIFVDLLSIDDGDPKKHSVTLRLGDYYYQYKNGKFKLLHGPRPQIGVPIHA